MTKEKLLFNKSTLIPFFHLAYAIVLSFTIFLTDEGIYEQNWNSLGEESRLIFALIVGNFTGQMIFYYLFRNHGMALRFTCSALFGIFIGMPIYLVLGGLLSLL